MGKQQVAVPSCCCKQVDRVCVTVRAVTVGVVLSGTESVTPVPFSGEGGLKPLRVPCIHHIAILVLDFFVVQFVHRTLRLARATALQLALRLNC